MKAFLVIKTFTDSNKEGVLFTSKDDAEDALNGCTEGSTLAVAFTDIYGDDELEMIEIEI
jgi:hypothetical protein